MFPQFGATAETLSKASTMVFRIGTDAHLYDDPDDVNIAPLLDSKYDSEKCEALKRLLALIAQGLDVSNFFPQVVKNVASQSLELKKLVYLYLLHYAEKHPNEALLSINCFQKDLGDPNALVRAWALRTMAGIRLHVIAPLVLVAVSKCARDPSVYVRKCAANALPKLHDLRQEEHNSTIEEIVGILLNDHSPAVVGAAAASFASVCPYNLSLIGRNYRKLCEILPDVEEWGQIVLIGILLRYAIARHGLVKESIMSSLKCTENFHAEKHVSDDNMGLGKESSDSWAYDSESVNMVFRCYIESPDEYLSRSSYANRASFELNGAQFTSGETNDDVKILLYSTSPLLWSNNSAVVLAAAGVHWIMAPKEDVKRIIKPLLFILRSSNASKFVVLNNIQVFAKAMPSLFAPHHEDFFIYSSDSYQVKALKVEILSSIATDSSISSIFKEFQDYIRDPDRRFAAATVAAIGLCALRLPRMAHICLVRSLDRIKVPAARAMIIWMMGEYSSLGEIIPRMLTTVLKYLAWCFTLEALETKLQILNTVSKVLLGATGEHLSTYKKVFSYLVELAECDLNYNVRDRSRFLKKLLSYNFVSEGVEEITCCHVVVDCIFKKQTREVKAESINYRFYLPGSLSHIVLHAAPGYEPLPKPCSLLLDDFNKPEGTCAIVKGAGDHGTSSDPSDNESASDYDSQHSFTGSSSGAHADDNESSEGNENPDPLIQFSDIGNASEVQDGVFHSSPANLGEMISNRALESWLEEQPGSSNPGILEQSQACKSLARISIGDVGRRIKRKSHSLLEAANGNGLKVDYSFSSEISTISHLLVCIEVFFKNCSSETITEITLVDEESNIASNDDVPTLVPMEKISSLEPGQTTRMILQVHFHHHLLPLKLALFHDGEKLPVKLWPDIGYFVKPLPMDVQAFADKESRLPGMFEYTRRCTFAGHIEERNKEFGDSLLNKDKYLAICESLAVKMLSNANISLVSVDMPVEAKLEDASGLRLRFSSEILSSSLPCLITITVEGKCSDPLNLSTKVNCEETVFALNLLNRIISFLVEPAY
ncbi:hypothetical protein GQ457_02G022820 [Hibiscus cannabinus]